MDNTQKERKNNTIQFETIITPSYVSQEN